MSDRTNEPCVLCGKKPEKPGELCNDLVCRPCHKTESFEDCMADKQVNAIRRQYGLPPREQE